MRITVLSTCHGLVFGEKGLLYNSRRLQEVNQMVTPVPFQAIVVSLILQGIRGLEVQLHYLDLGRYGSSLHVMPVVVL